MSSDHTFPGGPVGRIILGFIIAKIWRWLAKIFT